MDQKKSIFGNSMWMISERLLQAAVSILDYRFQAQLKYKNVAIAKGITYVIVAFWKFYIVLSAKSVEWFALSAVVDAAVACMILFIMYFRSGGRRFSLSFSVGKYLLRQGRPFAVASLITVLYNTMDKLMLGSICGDGETGIYDAAYFISFIWVFIPNAIMNSYRPGSGENHLAFV